MRSTSVDADVLKLDVDVVKLDMEVEWECQEVVEWNLVLIRRLLFESW